jgi:hypothetical protein
VKQPIRAYGSDALSKLQLDFVGNNYDLRRLMAEIATDAAFNADRAQDVASRTEQH